MSKRKYFTDQKLHRLTLIKELKQNNFPVKWLCLCECGNYKIIRISDIKAGHVRSCGCLVSDRRIIHNNSDKLLHNVFHSAKARCYNLKNKQYNDYGGRGVIICQEWLQNPRSFIDWALSNGWKQGLHLDKDIIPAKFGIPSLLYSPEMCCFVTQKENNRNTRGIRLIEYKNEVRCIAEWCELLNLSYKITYDRLTRLKWSPEKTFCYLRK